MAIQYVRTRETFPISPESKNRPSLGYQRIPLEGEAFDFLIGDFDAFGVGASIQLGMDLQAGLCACCGNQAYFGQQASTHIFSVVRFHVGVPPVMYGSSSFSNREIRVS